MLGWEFPPLINGGLGVACHGLSTALTQHVDLTVILPGMASPHSQLNLIGLNISAPESSERTALSPYLDAASPEKNPLYAGDLGARITTYAHAALAYAHQTSFDIIHAHDWMTALAGLEIQRATGKPLVFHIHSLAYDRSGPEERGWIYQIEKQIIAAANLVITVSHYTREICLQHYEGAPHKIFTVHNGAENITPFRSAPPFPEKLVLFLGRLTRQKAPHSFLKIAAQILKSNNDVRFILAGTGDQLSSLKEECLALGIADKVHFPGFQNREQVHTLLSQASVYCMPSASEPFGISALEAAQFGVPVVLSKQSGAAEALTHAPSAKAWDLDRMAQHIQELLRNDELHHHCSQALLAEQEKFTWQKAAQKVYGLYLMHFPIS